LGNIGGNIAKNIAVHYGKDPRSHTIVLWNRSRGKAEEVVKEVEERLEKDGGVASIKIADSVEDLVKQSDIVITVLASDAAVSEIYEKIIPALQDPGRVAHKKIIVDVSTVYPSLTGQLDSKVSAIPNTHFVAAPVFGATGAAAAAGLIVCLAGDYKAKKEVAYLLVPAAGRKVIDLGGNVEKAVSFKLVGNAFIASTVELLAETQTLADKVGVGRQNFHNFIQEMFPAPGLMKYSKRMLDDDFDGSAGFTLNGGLKDVHHIQRLASQYNCPMPFIDVTQRQLLTARALSTSNPPPNLAANSQLDWSAMVAASRVAAGLNPFDSQESTGVVPETED